MERYGVPLISSVTPGTLSVEQYNYVKTGKNKGEIYEEKNAEILVYGEMLFKWVNNDNPGPSPKGWSFSDAAVGDFGIR